MPKGTKMEHTSKTGFVLGLIIRVPDTSTRVEEARKNEIGRWNC